MLAAALLLGLAAVAVRSAAAPATGQPTVTSGHMSTMNCTTDAFGCKRCYAEVIGGGYAPYSITSQCTVRPAVPQSPQTGLQKQFDMQLSLRPQDYQSLAQAQQGDPAADGHSSCADGRSAYLTNSGAINWCWPSTVTTGAPNPQGSGGQVQLKAVESGLGMIATALPYILDRHAQAMWANTVVERQTAAIEGAVNYRSQVRNDAYADAASAMSTGAPAIATRLNTEAGAIGTTTSAIAQALRASASHLPTVPPAGSPDSLKNAVFDEILPPPSQPAIKALAQSGALRRRGTNLYPEFQALRDGSGGAKSDTVFDIGRERAKISAAPMSPDQYAATTAVLDVAHRFQRTPLADPLLTEARSMRLKAVGLSAVVAIAYVGPGGRITYRSTSRFPTGREAGSLYATIASVEADVAAVHTKINAFPAAFALNWPDEPSLGMKLAKALQDLTGYQGSALYDRGDLEEAKRQVEFADRTLDLALYSVPYARDAYEAFTGINLYTGKKLSDLDRSIAVLGCLIPWGSRVIAESEVLSRAVKYARDAADSAFDGALRWTATQIRKAGFPGVSPLSSNRAFKDYLLLEDTRIALGQTPEAFRPLDDRIKAFGRNPDSGEYINLVVRDSSQARHMPATVSDKRSVWMGSDPQQFIIDNFDRGIVKYDRDHQLNIYVQVSDDIGTWWEPTEKIGDEVTQATDMGRAKWARIKSPRPGSHVFPDGPPDRLPPPPPD